MVDVDTEMQDAGAVAGSSTGPGTVEGGGRRKRIRETNQEDPDGDDARIRDGDEEEEDEGPRRKRSRVIPPRQSPKPKTPNDWHLRRKEVPKSATTTKVSDICLNLNSNSNFLLVSTRGASPCTLGAPTSECRPTTCYHQRHRTLQPTF